MNNELIKFGIYTLEGLFACGVIGSAIVILMSMVDDLEVFVDSGHRPNTAPESE